MNKVSKTAILIVTFQAENWIQKCLKSCVNFNLNDIYVIDNASTDNTLELIPEGVKAYQLNQNYGFGVANNVGLKIIFDIKKYSYCFLLNQDATIFPSTINQLIETAKEYPKLGIISPIHLQGSGNLHDSEFLKYYRLSKKTKSNLLHVNFVNAAAWLIPQRTYSKVGGFHPAFFHTGEDNHYCQCVLKSGLLIGIDENAFIRHHREDRKPSKFRYNRILDRLIITILHPSNSILSKLVQFPPLLLKLVLSRFETFTVYKKFWTSLEKKKIQRILSYRKLKYVVTEVQ